MLRSYEISAEKECYTLVDGSDYAPGGRLWPGNVMAMQDLPTSSKPPLTSRRLLLVDDDTIFCELAGEVLRAAGACVAVKHDGAEAIDYLEEADCDLIVVDLIMPKVDGFRLISMLRHMRKTRHLPIIVVTSRRDQKAYKDTISMDISAYLTKPVNWSDLPNQVNRALQRTAL